MSFRPILKVTFTFFPSFIFLGEKDKNSGKLQLLKNGLIIKEWAMKGLSFGYQHKSPTVANKMSKK